jgi:hypothetical protein
LWQAEQPNFWFRAHWKFACAELYLKTFSWQGHLQICLCEFSFEKEGWLKKKKASLKKQKNSFFSSNSLRAQNSAKTSSQR